MEEEKKRIKISIGGITVQAELKPTRTANGLYDALPVEAAVNQWGEEFYCNIPGVKDHRETATTNVKVGDVAVLGTRQHVGCLFWADAHEHWPGSGSG